MKNLYYQVVGVAGAKNKVGGNILNQLLHLFKNRAYYRVRDNNFWQENQWVLFSSVVLFVIAVVWRSWPLYVNPNLFVEDTNHYFNYFYGNVRDYSSLFYKPNGYINILDNLIGKWVAHADVRVQPYLYAYIGTLIAVLASISLSFSGIFKNKYIIFIAPFLLGLSGLNHIFYYVTLTYQIYVLVILLLTLLFWEPIKNNVVNFFFFLLLSLLIWSGPYSVLTIPAACCLILFFRGKVKLMLALIVVTIAYTSSVNESTIWLHNILNEDIRYLWRNLLISRVILMDLGGAYSFTKLVVIVIAFAVIGYSFRKDRFYLKIAFILFGLINGALAAYLLSKKIALYLTVLPCHLVIAQFLWMALVLFTVDRFLTRNQKWCYAGPTAFLLIGAFIVYDNVTMPDKRMAPVMKNLPVFLQEIYKNEQLPLVENNEKVIISYGNDEHFQPVVTIGVLNDDKQTKIKRVHISSGK